ncbi:hypothetical protein EDB86DRAFT_2964080 [Lactarius hatsudake]|nr:hypothetical protein EDB86DRAFT_2964080 [Lactarius hatsudake]
MFGHDDFFATHLPALRLSRALAQEFPNTRAVCLNNSWNSVLANELTEVETLLSDVLRGVSILRSHLRPFNRLPPELLAHIFAFLGGGTYVVPASHVCQRWRDVALGTPELWTTIRQDDHFCAVQCFMERSQRMKLDVSFPVYMRQEGIKGFQAAFAHHASRIRRLHVDVNGDRVYDFYRSLAACDLVMPALEHFSIMMFEYGFPDDSRVDGPLSFFDESEFLTELTFKRALPLQTHLSPSIRSLTLADRVVDLDELLHCLAAAPNLEYLALLDSVPHTFDPSRRPVVTLDRLKEFHWFQGRVFDNVLGTVKLFEHLVLPRLDSPEFVLLLDPTKYAVVDLYMPCHRSTTLFHTITELCLEATHYSPDKPARNNIVFHGLHNRETLFSVRVHRASIESVCGGAPTSVDGSCVDGGGWGWDDGTGDGLLLASSVRVDLSHLTHLTLTSVHPYHWNRFFRSSWGGFFRRMPAVRVLRLYVHRPVDIITALASADDTSAPHLPALRVLHLFRCGGNGNDGANEVLLRFLKRRADLGIPIESIVCSAPPDDADGGNGNRGPGADADTDALLTPGVLSLVDSVEFGHPGKWADPPAFPRRMGTLLEEHLN